MRFIRSAATLTLAGAATLAASAVPAFAQGPTVIVTPSTVVPGASVMFTIICDHTNAASATLLGTTLGLSPQPMNPTSQSGEFIVTVNLPRSITPGTYTPPIGCSDGTMRTASLTVIPAPPPVIDVTPSVATPGTSVTFAITCGTGATSATLLGTTLGLSEQIPMDGSTHAGEFVTAVELPASISPGSYSPSIDCSNRVAGTAALTVNPVPTEPTPVPSGAPLTGDGTTSSATGGPFTAAGLALLAVGGLAVGAVVIRRRRAGARS